MPVKRFLGLGKNMFNSGITELVCDDSGEWSWQTILTERWDKRKYSGAWPLLPLEIINSREKQYQGISENRDVTDPQFYEELLQSKTPFYEKLQAKGLSHFISLKNDSLEVVNHHEAHAYSAIAQSPFEKSYILVMDGGGSRKGDFIEHTTLFLFDGERLQEVEKEWQIYEEVLGQPFKLAEGIGSFYERCAQLIFGNNLSSGKVMGLAGFGKSWYEPSLSLVQNQKKMDWSRAFKGKSKEEWESSNCQKYWRDLAATVQDAFEQNLFRWANKLLNSSESLPLILTGGCALNCTANFKLHKSGKFSEIFVPPNPGDEGISLGLAFRQAFLGGDISFSKRDIQSINSSHGLEVFYTKEDVLKAFCDYEVRDVQVLEGAIDRLLEGKVVAWFQGASETGPRALGHRSLLARVDRPGLKDYLNREIKFRENFRPYGASVLWEVASLYFDIQPNFHNPFMSFAVPIKQEYEILLKEITHIDGTCRMQTVSMKQNRRYHELLKSFGKKSGHPILLNTSLNIMGQPILESLEDAVAFMNSSCIETMVFNDFLINRKGVE